MPPEQTFLSSANTNTVFGLGMINAYTKVILWHCTLVEVFLFPRGTFYFTWPHLHQHVRSLSDPHTKISPFFSPILSLSLLTTSIFFTHLLSTYFQSSPPLLSSSPLKILSSISLSLSLRVGGDGRSAVPPSSPSSLPPTTTRRRRSAPSPPTPPPPTRRQQRSMPCGGPPPAHIW